MVETEDLDKDLEPIRVRACWLCGVTYNRTAYLRRLERRIRDRYRVVSPWTAQERSEDLG